MNYGIARNTVFRGNEPHAPRKFEAARLNASLEPSTPCVSKRVNGDAAQDVSNVIGRDKSMCGASMLRAQAMIPVALAAFGVFGPLIKVFGFRTPGQCNVLPCLTPKLYPGALGGRTLE